MPGYDVTPGFPDDPALIVHKLYDETIAGTKTFTTIPLINAGGAAGEGPLPAATQQFVISREMNLVTNGTGMLGSAYNFPGLTYVTTEPSCGRGSFRSPLTAGTCLTTELVPVNPLISYHLSFYVQNGDTGGGNYAANSRLSAGLNCYNGTYALITPTMYTHVVGAADTTLAAPLSPGQTTMTLTDATGWYNGATAGSRQMTWWPYVDANGCNYPAYTYSRNATNASLGVWNAGGITGNVVTLRTAWPTSSGTLPAGTPIRNSQSGVTTLNCAASSKVVPNALTRIDGKVGGYNTLGTVNNFTQFPYGTRYVRPVLVYNQTTAGSYWHFNEIQLTKFEFFNVGEIKTYTPEWRASVTNPVLGNGAIYGRYVVVGQLMWVTVEVLLGSTTTVGSGEYSFSMPEGFTYDNTSPLDIGSCSVLDNSATEYWSGWAYYGAPVPLGIHMRTPSATPNKGDQPVTTIHPITIADTDRLRVSIKVRLTGVFA